MSASLLIFVYYLCEAFLKIEIGDNLRACIGITGFLACFSGVVLFFLKKERATSWLAFCWVVCASIYILWVFAMFYVFVFM